MSSPRRTQPRLVAFLFALMVIPPIAFVASLVWLKRQPDELVLLFSGITATATIVASLLLAILHDRSMDEWHRSNTRFSNQWGWTVGASLVALLLAFPAFRDWVVSVVAKFAGIPDPNAKIVILAFTLGFMVIVLTQLVCTAVLSVGWTFWKSRGARDPA